MYDDAALNDRFVYDTHSRATSLWHIAAAVMEPKQSAVYLPDFVVRYQQNWNTLILQATDESGADIDIDSPDDVG